MSIGDWQATTTVSPAYSFTTSSNTGHFSIAARLNHEMAERLELGDDEAACATCPTALECAAGSLRKQHFVAKSREEHRNGYSLPCIDDGKTHLAVLTDAEVAEEMAWRTPTTCMTFTLPAPAPTPAPSSPTVWQEPLPSLGTYYAPNTVGLVQPTYTTVPPGSITLGGWYGP